MVAPVCHKSVDEVIVQPDPVTLPSVPVATDLASALAAINALRQIVNHITGFSSSGGNKGKQNAAKTSQWKRIDHQQKVVRVTNPQDSSQFVDVEQTTSVTMQDTTTGVKMKIEAL